MKLAALILIYLSGLGVSHSQAVLFGGKEQQAQITIMVSKNNIEICACWLEGQTTVAIHNHDRWSRATLDPGTFDSIYQAATACMVRSSQTSHPGPLEPLSTDESYILTMVSNTRTYTGFFSKEDLTSNDTGFRPVLTMMNDLVQADSQLK